MQQDISYTAEAKGLQSQYNKHMPHGKWQQENFYVSILATDKGIKRQPPLGICIKKQYLCRSTVWIHTTSVVRNHLDKECNGGLRLLVSAANGANTNPAWKNQLP